MPLLSHCRPSSDTRWVDPRQDVLLAVDDVAEVGEPDLLVGVRAADGLHVEGGSVAHPETAGPSLADVLQAGPFDGPVHPAGVELGYSGPAASRLP